MAITTNAICSTFKKELLRGFHDFDANGSGGDTYKLAMYTSSATLGKSTANYSTNPGGGSNTEVANTGTYAAGGKALVNQGVKVSSSVAITDFADLSFTGVTLTARGALIYNTQTNGGSSTTDAVCVLDFGGNKTATSGTFTIQFPAFTTAAAILRIA
tara:strand:+ start:91 stop:564 length:474 start_codon:yes stop_codon:yes gene_type:complete